MSKSNHNFFNLVFFSLSLKVFRLNGMMNLNARCHQSNLRVQPQLGKAVIWYNHFINETTGWLGDVDPFTWHGGCPVTKGKKWIMNRWIAVSNDRELDLELSWQLMPIVLLAVCSGFNLLMVRLKAESSGKFMQVRVALNAVLVSVIFYKLCKY